MGLYSSDSGQLIVMLAVSLREEKEKSTIMKAAKKEEEEEEEESRIEMTRVPILLHL